MTRIQRLSTGAVLIAGVLAGPMATLCQGYPEPSIVSRTWQFDFTYEKPKPIAIKDETGRTQWYWYMTYKLVNNTGSERVFVPSFTVAGDDGQIIVANDKLPTHAFDQIKQREGNRLLERPDQVVDKVLQGEDYARESVIVWPASGDEDVTRVSVFISGLSGETTSVVNPATNEQVTLYKVLMIDYDLPGRPQNPQSQAVVFRNETWVMR